MIKKFRVWDNRKKEFYYFTISGIMSSEVTNPILVALKMGIVESDQFAGATDKNGKDIYEGDILFQYPELGCDWTRPRKGIVIFENSSFDFAGKGYAYVLGQGIYEVVGNIYENS